MGRIKSTLIKRTSRNLTESLNESFSKDFEENKKALGNSLPSKRMRNRIAGYLTRIKKNQEKIIDNTENKDNQ